MYKRQVDELLQSLTQQSFKDFEVIVVEDGSSIPCKQVTEKYQELLDVHYYDKPNSVPGQTRNYGVERSKGEYLIILDSDCILPEGYFLAVEEELQHMTAVFPVSAKPTAAPVAANATRTVRKASTSRRNCRR